MTPRLWLRGGAVAAVAAGFFLLPGPFQAQSPARAGVLPPLPSPSLPAILPSPTAAAIATPASSPAAGATPSSGPTQAAAPTPVVTRSGGPRHGVSIPFTTVYVSSPLDVALIAALMALPLLLAIWLLLFGRTIMGATRARDAHLRLRLAADLGLHPRDLASMSTRNLFRLRDKAAYDELTGVLRAAAGIGAAEREIARSRRRRSSLCVAFVDVDGLKEENETAGRVAGDALLRRLVELLKRGLRAEDIVLRYAGDEFVCVLPETPLMDARARLDAIQLEAARVGVRFATGIAQLEPADDVVSLFARADRELYDFKANRGEIIPLPAPGEARPEPKGDRLTLA